MKILVQQPGGPPLSTPANRVLETIDRVANHVIPAIVQITNIQEKVDRFHEAYTVHAGSGSGVIIDPSGCILTNHHVVSGAQQLTVALSDGRAYPATLIGADPVTDLAVIQIDPPNLAVARLGNASQVRIGQWGIAIGYPLRHASGPIVSAGKIRALGRTVEEPPYTLSPKRRFLMDMLQTDAIISPGSSGGALVNLAGQVIGINTGYVRQMGSHSAAQEMGFAVSIATASRVAQQIIQFGKALHPYLGIHYMQITPPLAEQIGLQHSTGVIFTQVVQKSPAEASGLQKNDVITAVNHRPLVNDADFAEAVHAHHPGDRIDLTVHRGAQILLLRLTLGEISP